MEKEELEKLTINDVETVQSKGDYSGCIFIIGALGYYKCGCPSNINTYPHNCYYNGTIYKLKEKPTIESLITRMRTILNIECNPKETIFEKLYGLKNINNNLNTKNMNNLQIKIPNGHEIDLKNSNLAEGKVVFKEVKKELPNGIEDLPQKDSFFYISDDGVIEKTHLSDSSSDLNTIERESTAEAFLALMQLIRLWDYVNEGWFSDWENNKAKKFRITFYDNNIVYNWGYYRSETLSFKTEEIRDQFLEKYRDLIETAKELI